MRFRLGHARKEYDIVIKKEEGRYVLTLNDNEYSIHDVTIKDDSMSFVMGETRRRLRFVQDDARYYFALDGEYYIIDRAVPSRSGSKGAVAEQENSVVSPMPGLVVKLFVKAGDRVKRGAGIAIVEAMKMQNELRSPLDGVVRTVNFKEGDQVDALKPIVEIEALVQDQKEGTGGT